MLFRSILGNLAMAKETAGKLIDMTSGQKKIRCGEIQKLLGLYETDIGKMEASLKEIGIEEIGLVGKVRGAEDALENLASSAGSTEMDMAVLGASMSLKNYMMFKDADCYDETKTAIANLRAVARGLPTDVSAASNDAINRYESAFENYIAKQKEVTNLDLGTDKMAEEIDTLLAELTSDYRDNVADTRSTLITFSVIILLIGVVLAGLIFYLLSGTIARPIIVLKDAAIKIGEGNLDTKVQVKSEDEVGILSGAFEQMRTSLSDQVQELIEVIYSLSSSVSQIVATSTQMEIGRASCRERV